MWFKSLDDVPSGIRFMPFSHEVELRYLDLTNVSLSKTDTGFQVYDTEHTCNIAGEYMRTIHSAGYAVKALETLDVIHSRVMQHCTGISRNPMWLLRFIRICRHIAYSYYGNTWYYDPDAIEKSGVDDGILVVRNSFDNVKQLYDAARDVVSVSCRGFCSERVDGLNSWTGDFHHELISHGFDHKKWLMDSSDNQRKGTHTSDWLWMHDSSNIWSETDTLKMYVHNTYKATRTLCKFIEVVNEMYFLAIRDAFIKEDGGRRL